MMYVLYDFNPVTGHIDSRVNRELPDDSPELQKSGRIVANDMVPARVTTVHYDGSSQVEDYSLTSGWAIVVDAQGKPTYDDDGNLLVIPPQFSSPLADVTAHIFSALVKTGVIDPADIDTATLNNVNWSLQRANLPTLKGVPPVAMPVRSAVITQKGVVLTLKG